jgi:hypothetical protein
LTHSGDVGTGTIVLAAGKSFGNNTTVRNKRGKSAKSIEHEEIQKFAGAFGNSADTIDEGSVETALASIVITETAGGSIRIGNAVGAYIELKTNGDICIVPADQGVVRLGGEDADKAMLGMTGADAAGTVTGIPIISTMGGVIGSGGAPGSFASKIMVK